MTDKEYLSLCESLVDESQPFVTAIRYNVGLFVTGPNNYLRAKTLIFFLAKLLQELAICATDGDEAKGIQLVSEAINETNHLSVKNVNRVRKQMGE